ncbi:sensory histidine kinase AtoS [Citrobacter amalonaticus]|nr:sensory histidine kinase AtoS [Citrobacter amalonaticus]
MRFLRGLYPRRLRNQMILMALLMVIVPTLSIGYIVETEGRSAVLSEKEKNYLPLYTCSIRRWAIALPILRRCRGTNVFRR